jgi:hypothetical protein
VCFSYLYPAISHPRISYLYELVIQSYPMLSHPVPLSWDVNCSILVILFLLQILTYLMVSLQSNLSSTKGCLMDVIKQKNKNAKIRSSSDEYTVYFYKSVEIVNYRNTL